MKRFLTEIPTSLDGKKTPFSSITVSKKSPCTPINVETSFVDNTTPLQHWKWAIGAKYEEIGSETGQITLKGRGYFFFPAVSTTFPDFRYY